MSKRKTLLIPQGENYLLPITGHIVSEVQIKARLSPRLLFSDDQDNISHLQFESAVITLSRGGSEQILEGLKDGNEFDPRAFTPLVDLIGCSVHEAIAARRGTLILTLSEGWQLSVVPYCYEGWHFWSRDIALNGADGHLI